MATLGQLFTDNNNQIIILKGFIYDFYYSGHFRFVFLFFPNNKFYRKFDENFHIVQSHFAFSFLRICHNLIDIVETEKI